MDTREKGACGSQRPSVSTSLGVWACWEADFMWGSFGRHRSARWDVGRSGSGCQVGTGTRRKRERKFGWRTGCKALTREQNELRRCSAGNGNPLLVF